jgi:DNA-binding MarR family transcriptional regulator
MRALHRSEPAAIIDSIEVEPADELSLWLRVLTSYVRSGMPDLTNRQMALLLLVYVKDGPHTVRGLAETLDVSKPVITRALNKLCVLQFVRRQRDQDDRRNIFVMRTEKGADFLDAFGRFVAGTGDNDQSPPRPAVKRAR